MEIVQVIQAVDNRVRLIAGKPTVVRVLRSTGFEDSVIAEDEVDLRFKK